jgi:hypothetical protein
MNKKRANNKDEGKYHSDKAIIIQGTWHYRLCVGGPRSNELSLLKVLEECLCLCRPQPLLLRADTLLVQWLAKNIQSACYLARLSLNYYSCA